MFLVLVVYSTAHAESHRLTGKDIARLREAVTDEIYDYGNYSDFDQIGTNVGKPQHWIARLHLYIKPNYDSSSGGKMIYKFMPYGQIYRVFFLDSDGTVKLEGDPQNRFPPTQPSQQTVYMDEHAVIRYEQAWSEITFAIDTKPTNKVLSEASQRQKSRTGFSDSEYKQQHSANHAN